MNCPTCGAPSSVLDTRPRSNLTTTRRRACLRGHRFTTVELHSAAAVSAKQRAVVYAKTVRQRIAQRARDIAIAADLHRGWEPAAKRYGLTKSAVYLAAARGRKAVRHA